ncbi:protein of unknown function DUF1540 [Desulforamulus reducens MI-1]|uniref:DUF1540 domain-containing protein n=1 Tax=Desulforamulus reducens (strain ATCC BAA-1160 / DSM 100696 / MI-1) TaxID=349161 RepID=A4J1S6_DESRM|nr:DUF1540 domain-containing protein [Desulforamulus reducens]ABO49029.1 protein of unknown function DUF1540 [Desulforamulus reducens MI-1]
MHKSPRVLCEVNTCTHWLLGNLCTAANIDILYEEEGKMAQKDAHTECKTFYKKNGITSYLGSMDNVNWGGLVSGSFREGQQITPAVVCIVESCKYWAKGNLCEAETIQVSGQNANECQDTNCKTFEEK